MSCLPGASCRRVVLIDQSDLLTRGLRAALSQFEDAPDVAGVESTGLRHMQFAPGTVLLVDLCEPVIRGLAFVEAVVRGTVPPVAVFSEELDGGVVLECIRRGARGVLSKSAEPATLLAQLHELASGAMSIDSRMGGEFARFAADAPLAAWPGREHGLSHRESEVFVLLAGGLTNREISQQLIVGIETVKSHARAVYRKLGVRNRVEASAAANPMMSVSSAQLTGDDDGALHRVVDAADVGIGARIVEPMREGSRLGHRTELRTDQF
ncbi:MAG TPA: response regulator transcription factor [Acidimicrobiales bacterium]|nr:response regulator transcription factor [Acidimicrobiales bacterium]